MCRAICQLKEKNYYEACRQFGRDGKLTLFGLYEAGFRSPLHYTTPKEDSIGKLFNGFQKSNLYAAWCEAQQETTRRRDETITTVFKWTHWPFCVMYVDDSVSAVDTTFLQTTIDHLTFRVEPLRSWAERQTWW